MLLCRQYSPVWAKARSSRSKSAGLSVMLFTARLTAASTRLSPRYLSIGPVNFGFGAGSDVEGSASVWLGQHE